MSTVFEPANAFEAMALLEQEAKDGDVFEVWNDQVADFVRGQAARLNLRVELKIKEEVMPIT